MRMTACFRCSSPSNMNAELEADSNFRNFATNDVFRPKCSMEDLYCKVMSEYAYEDWLQNLGDHIKRIGKNYLHEDDPHLASAIIQTIDTDPCLRTIRKFLVRNNIRLEIIYSHNGDAPTGIQILALGTSTPINWISTLLEDGKVITKVLNHCQLQLVKDGRSAIILPKERSPVMAPPPSPTL